VTAVRAVQARTFLAFDFGTKRIGVASGNSVTPHATPVRTIAASERDDAIAALIADWHPDALVVGIPRHPDGAPHDNTRRAERFARHLRLRFKLPVHEVDERYTSVEAAAQGARDLDAAAAALILEQFLADLK
jgi:putative Holliday junction resolvase